LGCFIWSASERRSACRQTGLINEVCVRLLGWAPVRWHNRRHFFGVSARMMRRVLVEIARRRRAERRGGPNAIHVPLDGIDVPASEPATDLLAVDAALELLAVEDPQGAGRRTSDWALARAWLYRALRPADAH
jgi:RNA polymerase sigma-70 factor, ECF subfamily